MSRSIEAVKGFNDVLPGHSEAFLDAGKWQTIFDTATRVARAYGYAPAWLPIVESTALFSRGLGEETDVVSKEMYNFEDRGGRTLTLRPEGTAGAARAYIEHHLSRRDPSQKWIYAGPMFRAERPQKGRYRQFYQIGAEQFGAAGPAADVELLCMVMALCRALSLPDIKLRINTLGDHATRLHYRDALSKYLITHAEALCAQCRARVATNPLRVLDCKEAGCKAVLADAPDVLDSLTEPSRRWFGQYESLLGATSLTYDRSRTLVRGLDYYSEAIFEVTTHSLGAQDAVMGGGRYDALVEMLGGPPTPAVGFAAGVERLALLMQGDRASAQSAIVYLCGADEKGMALTLQLAEALRHEHELAVHLEGDVGRVKQALKKALRIGATHFAAIGGREAEARQLELKRLEDGQRQQVACNAAQIAAAIAH